MHKTADIKELANLMGIDAAKLRQTLLALGLGILQSDAERLNSTEKWNKKEHGLEYGAPEIRHFKEAYKNLTA